MTPKELDNFDWPLPTEPSSKISESICRVCTQDLTPYKVPNPKTRVIGSIGISAGLFVLLLIIGWFRHPPGTAVVMALVGAVVWGIIQAFVLYVGLGRAPGRRGSCTLRRVTLFVVLSIFLVHLTLSYTSFLSFPQFLTVVHSVRGTVVCGIHAVLFGALATAALFAIWRRTDPFRPGLTGALLGLAGGLVGAVALNITCPCYEAWHLWLGHGFTLLLVVFSGWLLGRKWLSP